MDKRDIFMIVLIIWIVVITVNIVLQHRSDKHNWKRTQHNIVDILRLQERNREQLQWYITPTQQDSLVGID